VSEHLNFPYKRKCKNYIIPLEKMSGEDKKFIKNFNFYEKKIDFEDLEKIQKDYRKKIFNVEKIKKNSKHVEFNNVVKINLNDLNQSSPLTGNKNLFPDLDLLKDVKTTQTTHNISADTNVYNNVLNNNYVNSNTITNTDPNKFYLEFLIEKYKFTILKNMYINRMVLEILSKPLTDYGLVISLLNFISNQ
jgi:hypothetical protein